MSEQHKKQHIEITFPQLGHTFVTDVVGLLHTLTKQGARIMGQLEDLQAAQTAQSAALDTLEAEVTTLTNEVNTLIGMIGSTTGIPQSVVDAANTIKTRMESVAAAFSAIPPAPGPNPNPTPPVAGSAQRSGKAFPGA